MSWFHDIKIVDERSVPLGLPIAVAGAIAGDAVPRSHGSAQDVQRPTAEAVPVVRDLGVLATKLAGNRVSEHGLVADRGDAQTAAACATEPVEGRDLGPSKQAGEQRAVGFLGPEGRVGARVGAVRVKHAAALDMRARASVDEAGFVGFRGRP